MIAFLLIFFLHSHGHHYGQVKHHRAPDPCSIVLINCPPQQPFPPPPPVPFQP